MPIFKPPATAEPNNLAPVPRFIVVFGAPEKNRTYDLPLGKGAGRSKYDNCELVITDVIASQNRCPNRV